MPLRHFPYKNPTFGTVKSPRTSSHWKQSVYYWWYEYLKRNDSYRRECVNGGKGKHAKLYDHFGNVHASNFKTWWTTKDRGAMLFAESPKPSIQVVARELLQTLDIDADQHLVLIVPLNLPIKHLVKRFREVMSKHHKGKRGRRYISSSQAMYQAKGKVDVKFLQIALAVWDCRKANPDKQLWAIGEEIGVAKKHRILEKDTVATKRDKKNILAATTSRYFKKADKMINKVVEGVFPH